MHSIKIYLENKIVTNYETNVLDTILSNWQIFYYNGTSIYSDDEGPIFIKGPQRKVILAIDPTDELVPSIRENIPIIFAKNRLLIGAKDGFAGSKQIPLEYSDLFGKQNNKVIVDGQFVAKIMGKLIDISSRILTYGFFPFYFLINFVYIIFEKLVLVFLFYIFMSITYPDKSNFQSSFRLIMFSSGLYAFFMPLSMLFSFFSSLAQILQLYSLILIIYSFKQPKLSNLS